jgi:putative transposase
MGWVDDRYRIPDELWARIEPLLPPKKPQPKGGRPWTADRAAMDGIFYVLRTGCQWKAMPRCFGAPSTVHDRFQIWGEAGLFERLWQAGLVEYDELQGLDWEWQAMDGAMTKAPLGGKRDGSQPHRSRKMWHKALDYDRRERSAHRSCGGWREPA